MRMLVKETTSEGLDCLLGKRVTLFCAAYIYTGKLVGVNKTCVKLEDASIVYETGPLMSKDWQDAQKFPQDWYVRLASVESFGELK